MNVKQAWIELPHDIAFYRPEICQWLLSEWLNREIRAIFIVVLCFSSYSASQTRWQWSVEMSFVYHALRFTLLLASFTIFHDSILH